ncbi:hypothetical protein Amet_1870 [Alkaliphilus metalliredigens QYMF]|uniref:DUF5673 domain-containing protein n=1 Tax=Alkaliphilus metalliredigens (strain QYMF) TaxID=293826 RepID=A6TPB8_ALKMQ|nr:hypothetical protein [Alkaliphilus metalliredigens]ABR48036.1 hypothetical protein Amet_1870 [Alkaliphilus metalliredigens QYMF]
MSMIFYVVPILVSIIIGFYISNMRKQQKAIYRERHIITASRNLFRLILGVNLIIVYIVAVIRFFTPIYTHVYSLFVPDYLNSWYELFWIEKIWSLYELLMEIEVLEAGILLFYLEDLTRFILSTFIPLIGIYFIYQGLQRVIISQSGIYFGGRIIRWDDLEEVAWKGTFKRSTKNYERLWINIKNSESKGPEAFREFTINLKEEDKHKVIILMEESKEIIIK